MQAAVALGDGRPKEAELQARAALEIRREALGADSGEAAACLSLLADVLLELGRQAHPSCSTTREVCSPPVKCCLFRPLL
jgi:hypothetical protein